MWVLGSIVGPDYYAYGPRNTVLAFHFYREKTSALSSPVDSLASQCAYPRYSIGALSAVVDPFFHHFCRQIKLQQNLTMVGFELQDFFSIAPTSGLETALIFWKPKSPFLNFLNNDEVPGTR